MSPESARLLQPTLEGPTLLLRPLREDDFEALYAAASDPLIWAQHPISNRYHRTVFRDWFAESIASGGSLVVIDRASGEVVGSSRYYEWDARQQSIAVGFTFLARSHWGGVANAELKGLMLEHAFRWVRTVWFHVAVSNVRSQRAMEKIGAKLSHQGTRQLSGSELEYSFFRIDRADPWRLGLRAEQKTKPMRSGKSGVSWEPL